MSTPILPVYPLRVSSYAVIGGLVFMSAGVLLALFGVAQSQPVAIYLSPVMQILSFCLAVVGATLPFRVKLRARAAGITLDRVWVLLPVVGFTTIAYHFAALTVGIVLTVQMLDANGGTVDLSVLQ